MDDNTPPTNQGAPGHAGAPENNTNGLRFKTPEERRAFLEAYCKHVAQGYSDLSFSYQGAGIKTFKHYEEMFPIEFPTDLIEDAQNRRLLFWETLGIQGTAGRLKGFNAKSWEFNMQNRFKWKVRNDVTTDDEKLETPILFIPEEKD